ncbi:hypothetical protein DFR68_1315 [Nocardia mexicana]|uniref:Uncharacterized protein n=1 Tax=Nocardia mexicana TaxID=279262 RepID=A0A370GEU5_9NOCA|nr:hypothetical protein DFR68_1315 [Nocardia mexicana]
MELADRNIEIQCVANPSKHAWWDVVRVSVTDGTPITGRLIYCVTG